MRAFSRKWLAAGLLALVTGVGGGAACLVANELRSSSCAGCSTAHHHGTDVGACELVLCLVVVGVAASLVAFRRRRLVSMVHLNRSVARRRSAPRFSLPVVPPSRAIATVRLRC